MIEEAVYSACKEFLFEIHLLQNLWTMTIGSGHHGLIGCLKFEELTQSHD